MATENIHRAVVVNDDGSVAGIVASMDILRVLAKGADAGVADVGGVEGS